MGADYSLARTIDKQISGLRRFFEEQSFLEVHLPHLTRAQTIPFRDTFRVSAPGLNFEGSLRVSGNLFLAEAVSNLRRVYTVDTRFRVKAIPGTHLPEFKMVEAWSVGSFEDALRFSEKLLQSQIRALLEESSPLNLKRARELESIKFPLESVTYQEVIKRTGLEARHPISSAVGHQLVRTFGSRPLFVTHIPENVDPSFADVHIDENGNYQGFVLIVPYTGILGNGGQLEVDYRVLSDQIERSNFLQELKKSGGEKSQLEPFLRTIASLEVPHFKLALGFERLTQFLIGADRIEEASVFPVYASRQSREPIIIIIDRIIIVTEPEPI